MATLAGGVWWVHQTDEAPRTRSAQFNPATGMPGAVPSAPVCSIAGQLSEGDARLIAAAPDMLRALRLAVVWMAGNGYSSDLEAGEIYEVVSAAIAKAQLIGGCDGK